MRWVAVFAVLFSCASLARCEDRGGISYFEKHIRPVLAASCYKCHSAANNKKEGGLQLDSRTAMMRGGESGAAIVPGKPLAGPLMDAISHGELKMPPDRKLTPAVIGHFRKWIAMGAPTPADFGEEKKSISEEPLWSVQPIKAAHAPQVADTSWPRGPIDRFLLARLEKNKLAPNGDAHPQVLLRRMSFDLIGLPPSPVELRRFEREWQTATDAGRSPDAVIARWADRLLASPAFGQRWGRHWLDVARFAESAGQSRNISYRFAWRYRNWVIDALNRDLPFDRFIIEQLAGDLLPAENKAEADRRVTATGFLVVGPKLLNENDRSLIYRMGVVDDQIDTTFRAFMGVTAGCARCHDHKYDPIPTRDYHAVAGIFRSTQNLAGVKSNNNQIDSGLYPLGHGGEALLAEIAKKQKEFADATKVFVAARRAKQKVEAQIRQLQPGENFAKEKAKLDAELKAASAELSKKQKIFARARRSIPEPPPSAMAVREAKTVVDSPIFQGGDVRKPEKKTVPRGVLATLVPKLKFPSPAKSQSGRLQLANWIAHPRNPLTARVAVNRIWSRLFGEGLVRSVDNFGRLGEKPTHPELLDDLAGRFVADGWSVKKLIREIVLSRTYRMSSRVSKDAEAIDPDNRLLWRMNRKRIEAESLRDGMLFAARRLDLAPLRGSIVHDMGMFEMRPQYLVSLKASYEKPQYRSVYLPVVRSALPEMMKLFDAPDPSLVTGKRSRTTVAPQSLFLMNSPFVRQQAASAGKIVEQIEQSKRANFVFRMILSRDATSAERNLVANFLRKSRAESPWTVVCHMLMATGEFRTLY